jgi:hypothetical protein
MAFKLTVDMPNLGPEGKVAITGLGELQNGKTYKISDEQAEAFRNQNSHVEDDLDPETKQLLGRSIVPGPALDEVEIAGIKVEKMADDRTARNEQSEEG